MPPAGPPPVQARTHVARPLHLDASRLLVPVLMPAPAPRLSATPGQVRHAGGEIGANTVDVLRTIGGLAAQEIESLLESGAAFDAEHASQVAARPVENTA